MSVRVALLAVFAAAGVLAAPGSSSRPAQPPPCTAGASSIAFGGVAHLTLYPTGCTLGGRR